MKILGIETSCDDTGVAILELKNKKLNILSNIVSSQAKLHAKYGGIWPFLAKREHQKNLPIILKKALKEIKNQKIDLIAVTVGPGLEPCLWVGINVAKELSKKMNLPLLPVNHVEAHLFSSFLSFDFPFSISNFKKIMPAIALVVSGGHTQLILMKDIGKYQILGETRDDAAGECFDKTARILGLGYPGGPAIVACADKFKIKNSKLKINLPRPMIYQKNYDFSFSGLKTAVLYLVKDLKKNSKKLSILQKKEIAFEIQQAIIDVLIAKTLKATKDFKAKSIILGGGVAANFQLREQLKERIEKEIPSCQFYFPDYQFCTDNAAMVAFSAILQIVKNKFKIKKINPEKIEANSNLKITQKLL